MPDEKKLTKPAPPLKGRSGEHPAVKQMRAKMESISDEEGMTAGALLDLDAKLGKFLEESRSSHPPAVQTPCETEPARTAVCSRGTLGCNVAHELEDTKATRPQKRVSDLCEHGLPFIACPDCTPRA